MSQYPNAQKNIRNLIVVDISQDGLQGYRSIEIKYNPYKNSEDLGKVLILMVSNLNSTWSLDI